MIRQCIFSCFCIHDDVVYFFFRSVYNAAKFQIVSLSDDDDDRHWIISSRHVGNCLEDEGWIQVVDKPKPRRNRCVCGYENVEKYPAIMYAKGNRKTRWSSGSEYIFVAYQSTTFSFMSGWAHQ